MRRVSIFLTVLALTVAFWDAPTQAQPVEDWYWVQVDTTGQVVNGGGSGFDGGRWFYYPDSGWWNEWFYNAPFDRERKKKIEVEMWVYPLEPTAHSLVEIAYNWSTDKWSYMGIPEPPIPPLPGPEEDFIQRHPITPGMVPVPPNGLYIKDEIYILDYNPEWVSIDVRGENFQIIFDPPDFVSTIKHECLPVKWKQLPDTTPNGIDIKVDDMRWLGDDFKCTSYGPLTGIHFWVSYLHDDFMISAIDTIHVEIYSDDPVGPGGSDPDNDFSKPDQRLWFRNFTRMEFAQRLYAKVEQGEYWWDPATAGSLMPGADREIHQIDIDISQDDTFTQEGSPDDPKIYWLVIQILKNPNFTGEIGWKTRQWPDHFMDDAVFDYGSELPHTWRELRYPPGHPYEDSMQPSIDLSFVIQGKEAQTPKPPFGPLKWSQPPVPHPQFPPEENYYLGWDEPSVLTYDLATQQIPICADDFYCLGPKPVTQIHWWGSFLGWNVEDLPPELPPAFQIAFWTDVPVSIPGNNFSHPGEMIHEIYCENYEIEFYGWDVSPSGLEEAKFQFLQKFDKGDWFWQDRNDEIYWVSIAADYGPWAVDPPTQHVWGWETRPHFFMDDAVRIYPGQDNIPPQLGYRLHLPPEGPDRVVPIEWEDESWDLSYELGTDPNYIKWAQPLDPRWPWNTDIWSQARYDPMTPEQKLIRFEAIVADDWPCQNPWPVTSIEWWGSYLGYDGSAGIALPQKPDFFLLSIWTDKPADPAEPDSYSRPDQRVWTYRAYDYVQVSVGKETMNNEVVFKYYVNLPVKNYFCQQENPDGTDTNIYWLSVVAVYPEHADPPYNWGWTNHEHVFMDDAAFDHDPISSADPWQFDWQELIDPLTGESWDMSFVIETEPTCFPCDDLDKYALWISLGKPDCWCYDCHDCGDTNGDCVLTYGIDVQAIINAWPPTGGIYDPCADINKDGVITYGGDVQVLINKWPANPQPGHNPGCIDCGTCVPIP